MLEGRQSQLASDFLNVAGNGSDETVEEPEVGIIGLGHVGKMMQRIFPGALAYDKHRPGGSATREEVARCQWFNSCLRQAGDAPTGIRVTRPGEGTCVRSGGHA